jgi:Tol biopolymer transport system component
VGKASQPFWIYYWQGNEVWRVDDQGKDRQLVIDTYKQLGQYLTDIPDPYKNTDCCWIGPRVVMSPDGQKLALVVVDKIKGTKNDQFTFSIFLFDIATSDLKLLSEGTQPVWSPDIRYIAFLKNRGLWIADLDTWQVRERIVADRQLDMHITEYTWSPDTTQIAYLYNFSMQRLPTIWAVYIDSTESARQLVNLDSGEIYGITWTPNAKQIIYFSTEGARDSRYIHDENLWSVTLGAGQRTQLTRDMMLRGGFISPDGKWLLYSGYQLYMQSVDAQARDLWLMSTDGKDLHRIQTNQNFGAAGWSPDGTRLILARDDIGLEALSLTDGKAAQIGGVRNNADYALGGVK